MTTAFDLTPSERYVLNALQNRQAANGWVFMPTPNDAWAERLDSLVAKGFIVRDDDPDLKDYFFKVMNKGD